MQSKQDTGVFMDPFVDFCFKRLFGTENNTDILLAFLNALFKGRKQIVSVRHLNREGLGNSQDNRKVIFDLYCETESGEKIIVELQNAAQKWFRHKSLFYAAMAIQQQELRGDWDFEIRPVYVICLMNFCFPDTDADRMVHEVDLIDKATGAVFSDLLHFVYVEMPKFRKKEQELNDEIDYWFYTFRHLAVLKEIPVTLRNREIFQKLFQIAQFTNLNTEDMNIYQVRLKERRDKKNTIDYARETGREEGMEEGREEGMERGRKSERLAIAASLKAEGVPYDLIVKVTGLSKEEI